MHRQKNESLRIIIIYLRFGFFYVNFNWIIRIMNARRERKYTGVKRETNKRISTYIII